MTWLLAPLLIGGASMLVARLVRAVDRAVGDPGRTSARVPMPAPGDRGRWSPRGGAYSAWRPPGADPHGTPRA